MRLRKKQFATGRVLPLVLVAVATTAIGVWVWSHPGTKANTTTSSQSSTPPSNATENPTNTTVGKAEQAQTAPSTATAPTTTKTGTTPGTSMATPTGQILNTTTISLSATSGPLYPGMESTVLQATPGSKITIVASMGSVVERVMAEGGVTDTNGQYNSPINWNARDKGLTPGTWNVYIRTTLNGQAALSQPAILKVQS